MAWKTEPSQMIMAFKPIYQEYNHIASVDCHIQSVEGIGVDQYNEMYDSERKGLEQFKVANLVYGLYMCIRIQLNANKCNINSFTIYNIKL